MLIQIRIACLQVMSLLVETRHIFYRSINALQATANLVPLNARRVAVKFDFFRIAGLVGALALLFLLL